MDPVPGAPALDEAHTIVGFVRGHLKVSKVRGRFNELEAEVVVGGPWEARA